VTIILNPIKGLFNPTYLFSCVSQQVN